MRKRPRCEYKGCRKKGIIRLKTVNTYLCREHFNRVARDLVFDLRKRSQTAKILNALGIIGRMRRCQNTAPRN